MEHEQGSHHEQKRDAHCGRRHQQSGFGGGVGLTSEVANVPDWVGMPHGKPNQVEGHGGESGEEEAEEGGVVGLPHHAPDPDAIV
eukprot:scaffold24592_cov90-Isochrysis_galbana.AAC.2